MKNVVLKGRMLAITAPIFWSLTGLIVRKMEGASEWQINFYRSGVVVLFVLCVLCWRYRGNALQHIKSTGFKAVVGGLCLGAAMFCNIFALKHTSVANAMLLMAVGPIVAAVLGMMLLNERPTKWTWFAVALTIIGISIMVGGGSTGSLLGDLVALGGMVGFGAYAVILRMGKAVDMTPAVLYGGIFSALAGAVMAFISGQGLIISTFDLLSCVFLGIVQLGIGSILFAWAAQYISATELTLFALGEPVLGPIWTWLGVGEVPSTATFIGGGIIFLALIIQAVTPAKK